MLETFIAHYLTNLYYGDESGKCRRCSGPIEPNDPFSIGEGTCRACIDGEDQAFEHLTIVAGLKQAA